MKNFLFLLLIFSVIDFTAFGLIGCGGGAVGDNSGKSWSGGGASLTIDDIVNDAGSGSSTLQMMSALNTVFYYGRFIYDDGDDLHCGSIKFKLVKEDTNSAYFSDVSLENMSTVINGTSTTPMVTTSVDLSVDPNYNASSNHVEITDSTSRFVGFDLDFGNNNYFGDIANAGVMFSTDFSTMAGGDDANFFFVAQKNDSQPDVINSDLVDHWSALRFSVNATTGVVTIESIVDVSIQSSNSNTLNPFTGTDAELGDFDGLLGLTDDSAGCFAYTFGTTIDGGFLLSADKSLAVGYDLTTQTYFAMER